MLYIFSGLPGTGKTSLSKALSVKLQAVYLRIDTIEQALKDNDFTNLYDQGYKIAFNLAYENLTMGLPVVADSTNPVLESREHWHKLAQKAHSKFVDIEILCSNKIEHKHRVENRESDIANLILPSWESVITRHYDEWTTSRVIIDTAGQTLPQSKKQLFDALSL